MKATQQVKRRTKIKAKGIAAVAVAKKTKKRKKNSGKSTRA